MVNAKDQHVQFNSVDDMIESFLRAGYDTVDNYKRVYGGEVDFQKPSVDENTIVIRFSRPVLFPADLVS